MFITFQSGCCYLDEHTSFSPSSWDQSWLCHNTSHITHTHTQKYLEPNLVYISVITPFFSERVGREGGGEGEREGAGGGEEDRYPIASDPGRTNCRLYFVDHLSEGQRSNLLASSWTPLPTAPPKHGPPLSPVQSSLH